jgi:hypothetical protein
MKPAVSAEDRELARGQAALDTYLASLTPEQCAELVDLAKRAGASIDYAKNLFGHFGAKSLSSEEMWAAAHYAGFSEKEIGQLTLRALCKALEWKAREPKRIAQELERLRKRRAGEPKRPRSKALRHGALLRKWKAEATNLTWETVAKDSGVSESRLHQIKKGAKPSDDLWAKLVKYFSQVARPQD